MPICRANEFEDRHAGKDFPTYRESRFGRNTNAGIMNEVVIRFNNKWYLIVIYK